MDALSSMQSFGLELPSSTYIFGAIVFGLIGLDAFRRGRRAGQRTTLWLGVALMVYPYAISQTWLLYAVGVTLCGWIYLDNHG